MHTSHALLSDHKFDRVLKNNNNNVTKIPLHLNCRISIKKNRLYGFPTYQSAPPFKNSYTLCSKKCHVLKEHQITSTICGSKKKNH